MAAVLDPMDVGLERRGTLRLRPRGLLRFGLSEEELFEIVVLASRRAGVDRV